MRRLLIALTCLLTLIAACDDGGSAEEDAAPAPPTEAVIAELGDFDTRPEQAEILEAVAWQEPVAPVTRENVFRMAPLGTLTSPGMLSTAFTHTFTADGTQIALLNNDFLISADLISGEILGTNTRQDAVFVAFLPDKTEILAATNGGEGIVFDALTGQQTYRFDASEATLPVYAFAPLSGLLAVGAADGTVTLWNPSARREAGRFAAHEGAVRRVAFSPDERILATVGGDDGTVRLWDLDMIGPGAQPLTTLTPVERPTRLVFSPTGDELAIAGTERAFVYSVPDGLLRFTLLVGRGGTSDVFAYAPDGTHIITGGQIPDMIVWDAATGDLIGLLPGVGQARIAAAFSPDGALLLTTVLDGGVSLWDMRQINRERREVIRAPLDVGSDRIFDVAFTPDGYQMLFFDATGPVLVYGITSTDEADS